MFSLRRQAEAALLDPLGVTPKKSKRSIINISIDLSKKKQKKVE